MKEFGTDLLYSDTKWENFIFYSQRLKDNTVEFWCFPSNVAPYHRPFPGFEVLERWLDENIPSAVYEIIWVDAKGTFLKVIIENSDEALMFSLMSNHRRLKNN